MNVNKKILVSDYDQTFYLNDSDLEKNKNAIDKFRKKGNIFVIATGRGYLSFYSQVNLYDIKYDYLIINHGATILDKNGNVLSNYSIKGEIISDIKKDLHLEKSIDSYSCSKLENSVSFCDNDLTKLGVKYNSKDEAMNICKNIDNKYSGFINAYYVTENSVEIISNEINKSKAICILLEKLGVSKNNVYTIGDSYSDIEMVRDFSGYCMKNSVEELKNIANREYSSVLELVNEIM